MCAGYHISTGKYGVVYMQNSGEGNAINPLLSLADEDVYSIPMLLVIGWRGEPGKHDEPQHVKQGKVTLGLLEAMGIDYLILDESKYCEQIDSALAYLKNNSKPFALIVKKGLFSDYKAAKENSVFSLTREDALKEIIALLSDEDIIVSTTGKTSREILKFAKLVSKGTVTIF
jgi:phosphonopyruvate decarboxylase